MKAIYIQEHVKVADLKVSDVPTPSLAPGHVLVSVEASGINPSDVASVEGKFPNAVLARIVGRDFAGARGGGSRGPIGAALQPVLARYKQRVPRVESTAAATMPPPSVSELAFSPLAFPTIVAPYGMAVLMLLVTLYPLSAGGLRILGVAAFVLAVDLFAMLSADLIAKTSFITSGLDILGAVIGILQVALGVQAVVDGLRLLRVVGVGG